MNIVEALTLAKEQGKKARPKCWAGRTSESRLWVGYLPGRFAFDAFSLLDRFGAFGAAEFRDVEELLGEWEVIE